jgi:uncharacterized glyoxalase superfamily protein PhnB
MSIRRVVPDFTAADPAASADFYRDVLGFELAMDMGWIATFVSPLHPTAQVTLMSKDATAPVNPDASIEVEDVDEMYARASAAGFEIIHPLTDEPWGVRRFFVRDPNGKVINVMSHSDG